MELKLSTIVSRIASLAVRATIGSVGALRAGQPRTLINYDGNIIILAKNSREA